MESKFDLAVFEPRNIFDTFDIYIYISSEIGELGETVLLRSHFHADKIDLYIHAVILYNIYIRFQRGKVESVPSRKRSLLSVGGRYRFSTEAALGQGIWNTSLGYLVRRFCMQNVFSRDSLHWITIGYRATISRDFILCKAIDYCILHIRYIFTFFFSLFPIFQSLFNFNSNL